MKSRKKLTKYGRSKNNRRHLLLAVLGILLVLFTAAQSANIRHYTVSDGLPSSVVYRCTQDHRGFMWFGTESGISRFDGKNFRNFSISDGLTETEILDIFCAANGDLWLIPFGGSPMRFDPVTQVCYTAANDPELKKIIYKGILNITQLSNGDILFSYSNNPGLYRYSDNKITEILIQNIQVFDYKAIKSIHEMKDGRILLNIPRHNIFLDMRSGNSQRISNIPGEVIKVKDDSVFSYDPSTNYLYALKLAAPDKVKIIDSVYLSKKAKKVNGWNDLMYFCNSSGGLDIYNHSLQLVSSLFPNELLNASFTDRDNNLWICSYTRGVYCIPVSKIKIFNTTTGLADDYVCAILPVKNEMVIAGFPNGEMQLINTTDGKITSLASTNESNLTNRVRKIIRTASDELLALSDQDLIFSGNRSITPLSKWNPSVSAPLGGKDICEYIKGRFLTATTHHLLDIDLTGKMVDTIYNGRTTCVEAGLKGDAWFSTINGVYYLENIRKKQYEYIGNRDTLLTRRMNNIVQGPDGLVWMASANAGVIVLKNNRVLTQITTAQGLASDLCRNLVIEGPAAKAWVATNNGISSIHYTMENGQFKYTVNNYNTSTGLPDNDINKVSLYDGKVYAATANGLAIFPPQSQQQNIPVHIVEILVEGQQQIIASQFRLRYFQNDITIAYTGICFTCAGKLEYQYRMLTGNNDTGWVTTSNQAITFTTMRPGKYTFQVKTATGSSITSIEFYIRRPWYSQWWFWGLCITGMAASVFLIYRLRVKNIEEKYTRAQQMAQLELQALQAQMNPHFIFNSLNSIQHFISENDSAKAQNYLGSFSRLMRLFLESSRSKFISLAQEKELLTLYLQLEQLRFGNRFSYTVETDPALNMGHEIPSMLIQPFAENAVNHGLFNRPGKDGNLFIHFYKEKNDLYCIIEDNGIGRKAAAEQQRDKKHISRGMQITEERLKTLEQSTGLKTHILVEDKYDDTGHATGTKVTIKITEQEEAV